MPRGGALPCALGLSGLTLLAALGLRGAPVTEAKGGNGSAQDDGKRKKKRKTKRGPAGPAGLADFKTRAVISSSSDALPAEAGARVNATADCGEGGQVVSCGYQTAGEAAQLVNVFVEAVLSNGDRPFCFASLFRTSEVAAAGGSIQSVAICLA